MSYCFAIPSGRTEADVQHILHSVGIDYTFTSPRAVTAELGNLRLFRAKPSDVVDYLALGRYHASICWSDLLEEPQDPRVLELLELGGEEILGRRKTYVMRFSFCGPTGTEKLLTNGEPFTLVTKYPAITRRWAEQKGLQCTIEKAHGGIEGLCPTFFDAFTEIVESGTSLEVNCHVEHEVILCPRLRLVVNRDVYFHNAEFRAWADDLRSRLVNVFDLPGRIAA